MTHLPRLTGFYMTGPPRNSLAATFPPIFTAFYFPNSTFCALKTGAINFIPLKSNAAHKDRPVNGGDQICGTLHAFSVSSAVYSQLKS